VARDASSWHLHHETKISGSNCHASVIGNDCPQLFPDDLCGSKVDRIKAAELDSWEQRRGAIE
jgi:hypothetical protein